MASTQFSSTRSQRVTTSKGGCVRGLPSCLSFRGDRRAVAVTRPCAQPPKAFNDHTPTGDSGKPEDEDDELDKLLGIGRYRNAEGSLLSNLSRLNSSNHVSSEEQTASDPNAQTSEVQETLADLVQMEVRRVRAREELVSDLEDRKAQMRAIGEEMKAALAREYELDRMRTEMNANYVMSEAFQALDDVEAEVQRIKKQVQADKADLAAWEAQSAQDRSKGLFFKSLYAVEKEPRKPVGKSIPGYWRKQREAAAAAAAAAAEAAGSGPHTADAAEAAIPTSSPASAWDPEAVAEAASRPLSAASRQVRSPLRLYLFSYLSAFLALLVINDVASSSPPHAAQDALYSILSTGLGFVAVQERQALGLAQDAMLEGIRRTGRSHRGSERSK